MDLEIDSENDHFLFEAISLTHLDNNIKLSKLFNTRSILIKRKADNPAFV